MTAPDGQTAPVIAIEEHWNSVGIRDALDRLPDGARDESVAFNAMGDNQARLEDIGPGRIEAMDAAGIDVAILSVVTPATQALPAGEAVALAREANDEATDAVRAHPGRFRARPGGASPSSSTRRSRRTSCAMPRTAAWTRWSTSAWRASAGAGTWTRAWPRCG
jgi:hypothetical protein